MRFMQTESVLQTKNWTEPAKNRFSVALSRTDIKGYLKENSYFLTCSVKQILMEGIW